MQHSKRKDESVKTGLEIAGHHVIDKDKEKDPDDLVHEQLDEEPGYSGEEDIDDLLHERDEGEEEGV